MSARDVRPVLLALVGAGVLYGLALVTRRDTRERNLAVLPADMVVSEAAETGDLSTAFANGIVQQTPPAGTIARGLPPIPYGPTLEEAKRAGEELTNPMPDTPEVLDRGAVVFNNQCACCHGPGGMGDGLVTKRGFPPPPVLLRPETKAMKDGEIFHRITFGQKNMPALAPQVPREDRWKVIRFVRKLQAEAK